MNNAHRSATRTAGRSAQHGRHPARSRSKLQDSYLEFAHNLADLAGEAIRPYFRRAVRVSNKGGRDGFDPVTAADRAAERGMRAAIISRFPDHGILGEEFAPRKGAGRHCWVLDPIDGTRAFIMGSPLWGTLIGLVEDRRPVLGLMDQPFTRERFWAHGRGSFMRTPEGATVKMRTRNCPGLAQAVLSTTHPDLFAPNDELEAFTTLKSRTRMVRYGGDCYGYCLLAAGFVDLVVEAGLKPHDIAALIPIIEGAGGVITTWDGTPATDGGRIIAAGDARVHKQALALLGG